jgi:hypothetical protein
VTVLFALDVEAKRLAALVLGADRGGVVAFGLFVAQLRQFGEMPFHIRALPPAFPFA